ncbi:histidine phosphotransferase family protein [Temperatibacter marinus]|uniref:Histidine phosphotransferase family protein n=1 Tax=Temperatibacter marinus TaxID=1456591 RepID=A0AA52EGZ3_9PROT|nr:histidine phosphotransferase family protein [Temperatibacter marinus]WND01886.1 histidine phosphotransferase family protein [Temperatibacter marinus]
MKNADFAGLLCSRLCHDLVSPVGAMSNGVELLHDKGNADMQEQIVDLLEDSVVQTTNKLKFFRLAFGLGGGFGAVINLEEAKLALASLFDKSKVTIAWSSDVAAADKNLMKILLNLALVAGECVIGEGILSISLEGLESDAEELIIIKASGARLIIHESVASAVEKSLSDVDADPKSIPVCLAKSLSLENGLGIRLDRGNETEMTFIVSKQG